MSRNKPGLYCTQLEASLVAPGNASGVVKSFNLVSLEQKSGPWCMESVITPEIQILITALQ